MLLTQPVLRRQGADTRMCVPEDVLKEQAFTFSPRNAFVALDFCSRAASLVSGLNASSCS
jgi:hypothetical protein